MAAWGTTTALLVNTTEISAESLTKIITCAKIAATVVGSVTSGACEVTKKLIKDEKINPIMVILMMICGGLHGYKIGPNVSEATIKDRLTKMATTCKDMV